jgi:hypothetical protein
VEETAETGIKNKIIIIKEDKRGSGLNRPDPFPFIRDKIFTGKSIRKTSLDAKWK